MLNVEMVSTPVRFSLRVPLDSTSRTTSRYALTTHGCNAGRRGRQGYSGVLGGGAQPRYPRFRGCRMSVGRREVAAACAAIVAACTANEPPGRAAAVKPSAQALPQPSAGTDPVSANAGGGGAKLASIAM